MAQENEEATQAQDVLQQYQIVERKQWEHRLYILIYLEIKLIILHVSNCYKLA